VGNSALDRAKLGRKKGNSSPPVNDDTSGQVDLMAEEGIDGRVVLEGVLVVICL